MRHDKFNLQNAVIILTSDEIILLILHGGTMLWYYQFFYGLVVICLIEDRITSATAEHGDTNPGSRRPHTTNCYYCLLLSPIFSLKILIFDIPVCPGTRSGLPARVISLRVPARLLLPQHHRRAPLLQWERY